MESNITKLDQFVQGLTAKTIVRIAIPEAYCAHLAKGERAPRQSAGKFLGFNIAVAVFELRSRKGVKKLLEEVFESRGCEILGEIRFEDRMIPLVLPLDVDVQIMDFDFENDERYPNEIKEERKIACEAYLPIFEMLARVSGKKVWYHANGGRKNLAPFKEEEGVIHIVSNASPPGPSSAHRLRALCGHLVAPDGSFIENVAGPTVGRGVVLSDERGTPAVQILKTTWYLFLPIISSFNTLTSKKILQAVLALAWNGMQQMPESVEDLSREAFVDVVAGGMYGSAASWIDKKLEKERKELEDLQRQVAEKMASIHWIVMSRDGFTEGKTAQECKERAPQDYDRIMNDGRITRVTYEHEAFHVFTKPLVVEHEGRRYDIGAVTIRIGTLGEIHVWTDDVRHPKGLAHPHVGESGFPCLGNASNVILEAVVENRLADAVLHLLTCLTEGYAPELTAHKIEEWPEIKSEPGENA